MDERKIFNTERYLNKTRQNKKEEYEDELNAATERLNIPFGEVNYKENDSIELSTKEFQLKFEYAQISEESKEDVQDFLKIIKEHRDYIEDKFLEIGGWREISQLEVDFKNEGKERIEFDRIMPPGYKIYFFPNKDMINGWQVGERKNIYIIGNLATPIAMITLLHEIGHGWDDEKVAEIGEEKLFTDSIHTGKVKRLRQERYATAFALKAIKPFFDRRNIFRKDALSFLKNYALESYNDNVKSALAHAEFLYHTMGKDMLEEESLSEQWYVDHMKREEFDEWKGTEDYMEWKKLEKYKNIEDWEEYNYWQEWCEENGRAWWNES